MCIRDSAYTDNINLSKKVSDELVVYVFTKEEYKKNASSNNIHTNTSSTSSSKESYQIGNEYKVFVYNKIAEDEYSLYGFKTKDEYELFLRLISVKGCLLYTSRCV